jgi:ankyrin repeat protein
MYAALKGHLALVKLLISKDADVNKSGWTPLHYAATHGDEDIVRLLLDQHAFVNAGSPNGTTPLMMAAQYGRPTTVKLLIEEGAEPLLKNEQGLNALDFARLGNRVDAQAIISQAILRSQPRGKW